MQATIALRPARPVDYDFALALYVETIKPYTMAYMDWVDAEQVARFAGLWTPADTQIITLDGVDIGWLEASEASSEIFLKQFYVTPAHQRHGVGTEVMQRLLRQWPAGKPVVLGVLKNNPARRLYERLGFALAGETETKFVMRREPPQRQPS